VRFLEQVYDEISLQVREKLRHENGYLVGRDAEFFGADRGFLDPERSAPKNSASRLTTDQQKYFSILTMA